MSASGFCTPRSAFRALKMAARLGFEPRQSDPESLVLPLHHRASNGVASLVTLFGESSRQAKARCLLLSLAPGFSRVSVLCEHENRFNGFPTSQLPVPADKPLKRLCRTMPLNTGLKPGANEKFSVRGSRLTHHASRI